jgi:phosphoserine aminotransferase
MINDKFTVAIILKTLSYRIYIMGRVLQWIERKGGLDAMADAASKKSSLIYNIIEDSNGFYYAPVAKNVRSKMNIPFRIGSSGGNDVLEKEFLKGAEALGLIQLKGHR